MLLFQNSMSAVCPAQDQNTPLFAISSEKNFQRATAPVDPKSERVITKKRGPTNMLEKKMNHELKKKTEVIYL